MIPTYVRQFTRLHDSQWLSLLDRAWPRPIFGSGEVLLSDDLFEYSSGPRDARQTLASLPMPMLVRSILERVNAHLALVEGTAGPLNSCLLSRSEGEAHPPGWRITSSIDASRAIAIVMLGGPQNFTWHRKRGHRGEVMTHYGFNMEPQSLTLLRPVFLNACTYRMHSRPEFDRIGPWLALTFRALHDSDRYDSERPTQK